jgi:hypothetical protein
MLLEQYQRRIATCKRPNTQITNTNPRQLIIAQQKLALAGNNLRNMTRQNCVMFGPQLQRLRLFVSLQQHALRITNPRRTRQIIDC